MFSAGKKSNVNDIKQVNIYSFYHQKFNDFITFVLIFKKRSNQKSVYEFFQY